MLDTVALWDTERKPLITYRQIDATFHRGA
jgi:hypothetical protein